MPYSEMLLIAVCAGAAVGLIAFIFAITYLPKSVWMPKKKIKKIHTGKKWHDLSDGIPFKCPKGEEWKKGNPALWFWKGF